MPLMEELILFKEELIKLQIWLKVVLMLLRVSNLGTRNITIKREKIRNLNKISEDSVSKDIPKSLEINIEQQ